MPRTKTSGQARFTRRLDQHQRDAILRSVLVDGRTVAETIRLANIGQLGIPAFDIGVYAYDIVRKYRDTFEERDEDALEAAIQRELKAAELDALAHIRAVRRSFKRDEASNPEALRRATQALAAIKKARRDAGATKHPAKPKPAPVQTTQPDASAGTIETLLKAAKRNARSGGSLARAPSDNAPTRAA